MSTPSDRDLLGQWVSVRDVEALELLVGRWQHRLFAFFYKATGDGDVAEDLRQDVLERVWRYADRHDPQYAVSTWIYAIATNVLRTWGRARKRSRETRFPDVGGLARLEPVDPAPGPDQRALESESQATVRRLISELDLESRELLLLRFEGDLSYREIAQVHHVPETTIKSRVYRALGKLRDSFERLERTERMKTQ